MRLSFKMFTELQSTTLLALRHLPPGELLFLLDFQDYHGFEKSRVPESLYQDALTRLNVRSEDVQVEIVRVARDLTQAVHRHNRSMAIVSILGPKEHLPEAVSARGYLGSTWFRISSGESKLIPPTTPHGFTVRENGILYFLSIQSPPIISGNGEDDYEPLTS